MSPLLNLQVTRWFSFADYRRDTVREAYGEVEDYARLGTINALEGRFRDPTRTNLLLVPTYLLAALVLALTWCVAIIAVVYAAMTFACYLVIYALSWIASRINSTPTSEDSRGKA